MLAEFLELLNEYLDMVLKLLWNPKRLNAYCHMKKSLDFYLNIRLMGGPLGPFKALEQPCINRYWRCRSARFG